METCRTKATSAAETLGPLEYEITCPVCHEYYTDPKILPCCHYYCKRCIQALVKVTGPGRPISCPECRRQTILTSEDVEQLVTVSVVRQLVDVVRNVVGVDDSLDATTLARSSPVVKRNSATTHPSLDKTRASTCDSRFCAEHDVLMKLFCFSCKAPVCSECVLNSHVDHPYEYVNVAANMFREGIEERVNSLRELKGTLELAMERVGSCEAKILQQSAASASKITAAFDDLCARAQRHQKELAHTLAQLTENKQRVVGEQKATLNSSVCSLSNCLDAFSTVLTQPPNDCLVVISHQTLLQEAAYQQKRCSELTLEPTEVPNIRPLLPNVSRIVKTCRSCSGVFTSEAFGPGLGTVEQGKRVCFFVLPLAPVLCAPNIQVSVTSLTDGSDVKVLIAEHPNGAFEVTYRPMARGWHRLCVSLSGMPVEGSPFSVLVTLPPARFKMPVRKIGCVSHSHGIAFNSKGMMVLSEYSANRVTLRDKGSGSVFELEGHQFDRPWGVTVDKNDNIYVSEEGANCITKFTRDGKYVKTFGGKGTKGDEELYGPRGLRVIDERLYVTERNKSCVRVFDPVSLQPLETLGDGIPYLTTDVAATPGGQLFICGTGASAIQVFSTETRARLRSIEHTDLQQPGGLFYDMHHDLLYVADPGSGCVFAFRADGTFVARFCDAVAETGLLLPWNVCVDDSGFVYVCDTSNCQILVF